MELSYKRSAALLLACFLYCSSLDFGSLREFRKTTLPILMLNFFSVDLIDVSSVLWTMCCFSFLVLPFLVQVSVMKMFKSFEKYVLQNVVSNDSLLLWWNCPINTALLCFSLAAYFVQLSMSKLFESFGRLHFQLWCWSFYLWILMMSPLNNVLLFFSRASFSGSSLSHEIVQIFCRMGFAKHEFKWFTVVLMEVSYRHSAALLFACCLYRSSLNIEALRDVR